MTSPRKLRRFFSSSPLPENGERVFLSLEETRHLKKTLRLQAGDRCLVVDGSGAEVEARIESFEMSGQTALRVEKKLNSKNNNTLPYLRVFVGLPQKGKMDIIIEKAQELGVQEIWPMETDWTVVKMRGPGQVRAMQRWEKLAREAAKQSGSALLTKVHSPVTFHKAFEQIESHEKTAIFHPDADSTSFPDWLKSLGKDPQRVNVLIGPEGGFTDKEVAFAKAENIPKVRLGETLLKVDTAFVGILSSLRFLFL